ncbi:MAG TPA: hypothetical protein VMZ25_00785 [Terriglobales bacterium]|nr:hypothetical protein [Terriglobales bacterium]
METLFTGAISRTVFDSVQNAAETLSSGTSLVAPDNKPKTSDKKQEGKDGQGSSSQQDKQKKQQGQQQQQQQRQDEKQ